MRACWLGLVFVAGADALVGVSPRRQRRLAPTLAIKEVTLGLGCFWAPSEELLKVDGVVETRCGYAGAAFPDAKPSYDSVCGGDGNVETVRVEYDDAKVSYDEVLDSAFASAKPVLGSRQYAPVIFARDGAEADRAKAWIRRSATRHDGLEKAQFGVEVTDTFWDAEAYHQTYWQRWRPRAAVLMGLFALQFGDTLDSTGDNAAMALSLLIALTFVGERVIGGGVELAGRT